MQKSFELRLVHALAVLFIVRVYVPPSVSSVFVRQAPGIAALSDFVPQPEDCLLPRDPIDD